MIELGVKASCTSHSASWCSFRKELHFLPDRLPSLFYNSASGSPRVAAGNVGISSQWWWQYQLWMWPSFQLPRLGWLQEECPQGRCLWRPFVWWLMFPLLWTLLKDACFEPCFKDGTRFLVEIHQNNHRQIYVSSITSVGSVLSIIELGCKGFGSNWLATGHWRQVRGVVVGW